MAWLIEPRFSSGGQGVRMAEVIVSVASCVEEGGERTVPAGSRIVLRFGWAQKNRGQVQAFLNAQTSTISLNGAAPIDVSDSYSPIEELPDGGFLDGGFVSRVRHDTGVTLSAASPFRWMSRLRFHIRSSISSTRPHTSRSFSNPGIHSL